MEDKIRFGLDGTDGFTVEQVKSLVGSNKKMQRLYNQGKFDTEMEVSLWLHEGFSFVSSFIGCSCPSPGIIIDFFRYILNECIKSFSTYEEHMWVNVCQLFCREDKYIMYCDDSTVIVVDNDFNIISDDVKLSNGEEFIKKLKEVITWINRVSPVPVYGVEYWCRGTIQKVDDFGKDIDGWLMGYCEALLENNYLTVDEDLGDVPGEYVLGFIEKEYFNN